MTDLFDILRLYGLQGRLLRQWHNATGQGTSVFDERELLTIELLGQYGPITERKLAKLFGMPSSSANSMTKRLRALGAIEQIELRDGDKRNRPLQLTSKGRQILADLAAKSDERNKLFFADFSEAEKQTFTKLLTKFSSVLSGRIDDVLFEEKKWAAPLPESAPRRRK